jgi:hypothetical protein
MIARGHVQNGVVILEQGVKLREGQSVTVVTSQPVDLPTVSHTARHSLLDVPPVSLGSILCDNSSDDDLLDEMLADRP